MGRHWAARRIRHVRQIKNMWPNCANLMHPGLQAQDILLACSSYRSGDVFFPGDVGHCSSAIGPWTAPLIQVLQKFDCFQDQDHKSRPRPLFWGVGPPTIRNQYQKHVWIHNRESRLPGNTERWSLGNGAPIFLSGGFKFIDAWCNLPWTDELSWGLITNFMRITKGFLPGIPFPRRFSFTVSSRESFFTKAFPLCTEMPFHEGPFTNYKYIYEITYMKLHIWNYIYENYIYEMNM